MIRSPHSLRRRAHTLTELLVVMSIIGILSALTFFGYAYTVRTAAQYEAIANAARSGRPPQARPPVILPNPGQPNPALDTGNYGYVPDQYLVAFAANVQNPATEADRLATTYQGRVIAVYNRLGRYAALQVPAGQYAAFAADPAIALIEKNFIAKIAQQTTPTGVRRMFSYPREPANHLVLRRPVPQSRNRNIQLNRGGSANMINVAIMDTGIDGNHPDLNVVVQHPFNGLTPTDEHGHGTHVAGTVGARGNNLGVIGVYPGAPLWSLRVFDASGSGSFAVIGQAMQYVFDNADRIQVCNMSIGGPASVILNAMVDACVDRGVIMVSAAGNSTVDASTFSPASASKGICVGAMADSDGRPGALGGPTSAGNDDTFATFSNFGPTVTVVAPGVDILSTLPNNQYGLKSGTSMACPHVAGLCALLLDPTTGFGTNHRNLWVNSPRNIGMMTRPFFRFIATETIPGINGENLNYPLINFRVQ